MKVKLLKKYINTTNKDGQPLINKKGDPYTMVTIEFEVAGNTRKASMYIGGKIGAKDLETIQTWEEGQEVEIVVEQNGQYNNFHLPGKTDLLEIS